MDKFSKITSLALASALAFAGVCGITSTFADSGAISTGHNTGGNGADSYVGTSTTGSTGNNASRSSYTGVFASWDTGIHVETVTSPNQAFSTPEIRYGNTVIPAMTVTAGNDMPVGSEINIVAVYAENSGFVYKDGVRTPVQVGELLAYIPAGGLTRADGSRSTSWDLWHSNGRFGDKPISEGLAYLNQLVDAGQLDKFLQDNPELTAWGGKKALEKMSKEEIKKLLCEENCEPTTPEETVSCHVGEHAGWTEGHTSVSNMTKGTGWVQDGTVWARPGDTIRFKIDFCWGAMAVTGTNGDSSSPYAIDDFGITQVNSDSFYPTRGGGADVGMSWFQLGSNRGNSYLFGVNEQYIGTARYTLTKPHNDTIGVAVERPDMNNYVDSTGDYAFMVLSPSSKGEDSDSYNCTMFDFGAFTINGSHGFQIPGATVGGCNASGRTGNNNEAGQTISQSISYHDVEAWQQWGHAERGKGCDSCCTYTEGEPTKNQACIDRSEQDKNDLYIKNNNKYDNPYTSARASAGAGTWGLYELQKYSTEWSSESQCEHPNCGIQQWTRPRNSCYWKTVCSGKEVERDGATHCEYVDGNSPGEWKQVSENSSWIESSPVRPSNTCINDNSYCTREGFTEDNVATCFSEQWVQNYVKPTFNYTTSAKNNGDATRTATVNIPYSYRTSLTSAIQEGDVIYTGETVYSMFTASIVPRIVSEVRASEAYATTVPGYIKAVEFVVSKDSTLSKSTGTSNNGGGDPCSYYADLGMISGCNTIWEEHGSGGHLNEEGRYGGKTYTSGSVSRVVPDVYPIGSKYCVAVGISTSDSHGQPDSQVVGGMSSPSGWRISNLSCRTIAKKPNFEVWNGNFYTKGSVKTSVTIKRVGANLGEPIDATGYFGSWEEYILSAKGAVTGFSSGTGLGYYGGYNSNSLGLQGGVSPGTSYCELSHMTIANDQCSVSASEYYSNRYVAGNSLIEDSAATLLERIRSRYLSSNKGITTLENGATYIYPDQANINTSQLYQIAHGALQNTELGPSVIRQTKGAINSQSEQTTRNYASNALVIHVTGTLTIDTDICAGSGDCGSNTNLHLGFRNSSYYTNIYSVPQILIIADGGIMIRDNVTQIDAWLITNGNINTCNGLNYYASGFSASTCGRQLIVNGPVFAGSLTLSRNSGADPGAGYGNNIYDYGGNPIYYNLTDDGSVQPAEIFNLRPDVLFWAYSQAQRYSQANVTYTRELAPRY